MGKINYTDLCTIKPYDISNIHKEHPVNSVQNNTKCTIWNLVYISKQQSLVCVLNFSSWTHQLQPWAPFCHKTIHFQTVATCTTKIQVCETYKWCHVKNHNFLPTKGIQNLTVTSPMHIKDQCNSVHPETPLEQTGAEQKSGLAGNSAVLQEDVAEAKCLCIALCEPAAWNHYMQWLLTIH